MSSTRSRRQQPMAGSVATLALLFVAFATAISALQAETAPSWVSRPWMNTTNGTHLFLTFMDEVPDKAARSLKPEQYVFVWGSSQVKEFRMGTNPNISLSKYIPFNRDFTGRNLTWWQENHPSWVWYRCDKKTPARIFHDPIIPVDITNMEVIDWQLNEAVLPAKSLGYDGMAMDNVALENGGRACGIWRNGTWVQLFTGEPEDPAYASAVVNWMKQYHAKVKKTGLKVTINYSLGANRPNNTNVMSVSNHTDGILSEEGFTTFGSFFRYGQDWVDIIEWMLAVQRNGKAFFSNNEWGHTRHNLTNAERSWLLASYLVAKLDRAAFYTSAIQGYGFLLSDPFWTEFETGLPLDGLAGPTVDAATGVYIRNYTLVTALVNPTSEDATLDVAPIGGGGSLCDYWGTAYPRVGLVLPKRSAVVLKPCA